CRPWPCTACAIQFQGGANGTEESPQQAGGPDAARPGSAAPAPRPGVPPPAGGLRRSGPFAVEEMSNRELIGHTLENATLLVKKEIELARAELRADLKAEVAMVKGLGVAGLCALCTLNM